MHIATIVASLILLVTAPLATAQTNASNLFDKNARGLTLNEVLGDTLVGVTRDGSKTFSLYLDWNKKAHFRFSNGTRNTATWRKPAKDLICFKGLNAKKPWEEVCKLARPRGRGLDWRTVKVNKKAGNTVYFDYVNKTEKSGSSQIVYRFDGNQIINPNSYISDLRKWRGRVVVGRTLKDKEAWMAHLRKSGQIVFVFGSGRKLYGNYTLQRDRICMTFPSQSNSNGCRKPNVKGSKIHWTDAKSGLAISEVVYLTPPFDHKKPPAKKKPKKKTYEVTVLEPPKEETEPTLVAEKDTKFNIVEVSASGDSIFAVDTKFGRLYQFSGHTGHKYLSPKDWGAYRAPKASTIDISANGKVLAYATRYGLKVQHVSEKSNFVETEARALGLKFGQGISQIALSPDGKRLAVVMGQDGLVVLSTEDLSVIWKHQDLMIAHEVTISRDGTRVASAGDGGFLDLFDLKTGERLASGSFGTKAEGKAAISTTATDNQKRKLKVSRVAFSPSGKFLGVGTRGGVFAIAETEGDFMSEVSRSDGQSIRDLDAFEKGGKEYFIIAAKDSNTRIRLAENGKLTGIVYGAEDAIEIDVIQADPLIALVTPESGGLAFHAESATGRAAIKLRNRRNDKGAEALGKATKAAFLATFEQRKERAKKIASAYKEGRCDAFAAFGSEAKKYEEKERITCRENAEKDRLSKLKRSVELAIRKGDCRETRRLARDLPASSALNRDVAADMCRHVRIAEHDLGKDLKENIEAGICDDVERAIPIVLASEHFLRFGKGKTDVPPGLLQQAIENAKSQCQRNYLLKRASAKEMWLSGVRLERAGDLKAAMNMYEKLMDRHPDHDLALKASDRTLVLIDKQP